MARWLMIAGLLLITLGALLHFVPWTLNWFGKLPGDIQIKTEQGKIYIPVTSMLMTSITLTILINLFKRF